MKPLGGEGGDDPRLTHRPPREQFGTAIPLSRCHQRYEQRRPALLATGSKICNSLGQYQRGGPLRGFPRPIRCSSRFWHHHGVRLAHVESETRSSRDVTSGRPGITPSEVSEQKKKKKELWWWKLSKTLMSTMERRNGMQEEAISVRVNSLHEVRKKERPSLKHAAGAVIGLHADSQLSAPDAVPSVTGD